MKITYKILSFILWLSLLLTAGGCGSRTSEPEIEDPVNQGPKIFVTFNVALQKSPGASTRSGESTSVEDWDHTTLPREDGNEFDCRIVKDHFSAIIYKKDNSFVGTIKEIKATRSEETPSVYRLTFIGILDTAFTDADFKDSKDKDFKIMIFANIPETFEPSGAADESGPEALTFSRKGKASEFNSIPMWGVQEISMNSLVSAERYDESKLNKLGTVYLLRAMAMVRVLFSEEVTQQGAELISLTLNRHNTSGFTLPSNWDETTYTPSLLLAETLRENQDNEQDPLSVEASEDEKSFMQFYLPEVANSKDNELTLSVQYRFANETRTGEIKFRNYENGQPKEGDADRYNIVRNHIYEFKITKIGPSDITLNAAVRDWRIIRYEYEY